MNRLIERAVYGCHSKNKQRVTSNVILNHILCLSLQTCSCPCSSLSSVKWELRKTDINYSITEDPLSIKALSPAQTPDGKHEPREMQLPCYQLQAASVLWL